MAQTFVVRLKGGPGSGYRGHAGRPGAVGGSSPSMSPFVTAGGPAYDIGKVKPKNAVGFDEEAERNSIFTYNQSKRNWDLAEGATREQAVRYYARSSAVTSAMSQVYAGGRESIASTLNRRFDEGYNNVYRKGRYYYFSKPETSSGQDILRLNSDIERNYIQTMLNIGDFSKNY